MNNSKFAFLMKKKRLDYKWKQDYVALRLNISKSYYSELERGKVVIPVYLLRDIKTIYNIREFNENKIKELRDNLIHCFIRLYNCDINVSNDYDNILKHKTDYINSILCLEYWLLTYIYSVTKRDKLIYSTELKKYKNYFSVDEENFYHLYRCIQYRNEYNDLEALKMAEFLLKKKTENSYFKAILNYHSAFLYYQQGDCIHSLKCIVSAKELFKSTFNKSRYYLALSHEAVIYTKARMFQLADEININLVQCAKNNVLDVDYNVIICNSSVNMILSLQYERSLYYLNLKTNNWNLVQPFYFNYSWTLYKLNQHAQALDFISDNYDKISDLFVKRTLNIIKLLIIDEKSNELLVALKESEKFINKTSVDFEGHIFIYSQLLNFYKRKSNLKQQIKYMDKILGIQKLECNIYNT